MGMDKMYDAVIIGGGPSGLTAALYLARAMYRVLVVEREQFGGQISTTSEVVNYPGVGFTGGSKLAETMQKQAEKFGAEFLAAEVTSLEPRGDIKTVHTTKGTLQCFGVILAMGAHPRMIGFEGEAEFRGHGVAYCATCDGEFFTGKEIFVIGGGYAAAEESVFLAKYGRHVTILVREEDFTCARAVADEARNHPKITVLYQTEVEAVSGDTAVRAIRYRNNVTGKVTEYHAKEGENIGVFVLAGYEPETSLIQGMVKLNAQGYVVADNDRKTNINGIYAAGDICEKKLRQLVTAVSDGAVAATELERYVSAMQRETGITPDIPKNTKEEKPSVEAASSGSGFFTEEMDAQLDSVFGRMERGLVLKLYLDDKPVSGELKEYVKAMAERTKKLTVQIAEKPEQEEFRPCVRICREDGTEAGLAFHGVPGGHEFTSFVMGLYNAAGPGQEIDAGDRESIAGITKSMKIQVLVTLSCSMCPELVMAAQKIAAENPNVTAEIYDVKHFPKLRERHRVMSVPCLVVDGKAISFGKKNLRQLLDLIS